MGAALQRVLPNFAGEFVGTDALSIAGDEWTVFIYWNGGDDYVWDLGIVDDFQTMWWGRNHPRRRNRLAH